MARYESERTAKVSESGNEAALFVIRGYGYAETHLAELNPREVVVLRDSRFGYRAQCFAVASPVAGICGSRIAARRGT